MTGGAETHGGPAPAGHHPLSFVLALVALLLPPAVVLAPLAVQPLGLVAALAAIGLLALRRPGRRRLPLAPIILLLLLITWAGLSQFWTIAPDETAHQLGKLVAVLVGAVPILCLSTVLTGLEAVRIGRWLVIGMAFAIALLLGQGVTQGLLINWVRAAAGQDPAVNPASATNNGLTVAILLLPSLLIWYLRRRWLPMGLILGVLLAAATVMGESMSAQMAFIALVLAGVAGMLLPRMAPVLIVCGMLIVGSVLPPVLTSSLDPDTIAETPEPLRHRLGIWNFSSERILERPWLGWGLGSSREIPGAHGTAPGTHGELIPLHPHNGLLQLRLELGWPGLFLVAAVLLAACLPGRGAPLPDRAMGAARSAALAPAIVVLSISYGVWQGWWLVSLAVIAGLTALFTRSPPEEPRSTS